jgi:hypothetical protein
MALHIVIIIVAILFYFYEKLLELTSKYLPSMLNLSDVPAMFHYHLLLIADIKTILHIPGYS